MIDVADLFICQACLSLHYTALGTKDLAKICEVKEYSDYG